MNPSKSLLKAPLLQGGGLIGDPPFHLRRSLQGRCSAAPPRSLAAMVGCRHDEEVDKAEVINSVVGCRFVPRAMLPGFVALRAAVATGFCRAAAIAGARSRHYEVGCANALALLPAMKEWRSGEEEKFRADTHFHLRSNVMASSENVELEAAKFLDKLIQDSTDGPAKLATKLYVILQNMESSGKEHSMSYQGC